MVIVCGYPKSKWLKGAVLFLEMLRVNSAVSSLASLVCVTWARSLGARGRLTGQEAKMASFICLVNAADGRGASELLGASGAQHLHQSPRRRQK